MPAEFTKMTKTQSSIGKHPLLSLTNSTRNNAPILGQSDLDLHNIDPFLYGSISFMIIYQYQYVVQTYRLNYGIIGTCLRKGLSISMTD